MNTEKRYTCRHCAEETYFRPLCRTCQRLSIDERINQRGNEELESRLRDSHYTARVNNAVADSVAKNSGRK